MIVVLQSQQTKLQCSFDEEKVWDRLHVRVSCVCQDYGGFLTLTMLKSTERMIRCAAAQAAVVDWTTYGEQKLLLPLLQSISILHDLFLMLCLRSATLIILTAYGNSGLLDFRMVFLISWFVKSINRKSSLVSHLDNLPSFSLCFFREILRLAFDWGEQIPSEFP